MRLVAFRGSVCTPSRGSQKVAPDSDLPIVALSHGYGATATATAMDPTVPNAAAQAHLVTGHGWEPDSHVQEQAICPCHASSGGRRSN